jgi:hypothetical protein
MDERGEILVLLRARRHLVRRREPPRRC